MCGLIEFQIVTEFVYNPICPAKFKWLASFAAKQQICKYSQLTSKMTIFVLVSRPRAWYPKQLSKTPQTPPLRNYTGSYWTKTHCSFFGHEPSLCKIVPTFARENGHKNLSTSFVTNTNQYYVLNKLTYAVSIKCLWISPSFVHQSAVVDQGCFFTVQVPAT